MLIKKKGKAAIYVIKREGDAAGKRMDQKLYLSVDCGLINLSAVSATIYSPFHLK